MRGIKRIVWHCTATSQNTTVYNIKKYWRERMGWKSPGYHLIIEPNGDMVQLAQFHAIVNGARGYNFDSIHVSYIGGKDVDDRTEAQIRTQKTVYKLLSQFFPEAEHVGHRDLNKYKSCPRFEIKDLLK